MVLRRLLVNNLRSRLILIVIVGLLVAVTGGQVLAQDTTITFLTPPWGVPPDQAALDAFTAETGIAVEVQSLPMDQLYSRVQVAQASGQEPADVIFLSEEAPSNIVATGVMEPLNSYVESNPDLDLTDYENVDFWTVDGNIYGIPTYSQLVMADYNVAKAQEAGFDAPPATWEELRDQAVAIKEQGIEDYPIAMSPIDWSWYLMALSMGDPMFDADLNPVFADEGSQGRAAMELLLSFFQDELISPELLTNTTGQHSTFWSGAGVFHQSFQGAARIGNNPDVSAQAPNVAYLPLPGGGGTWSQGAAIGIAANSDAKDAAWQFIQWYLGEENQVNIYNAVGLVPSRLSVQQALDAEGAIEGYDVIADQSTRVTNLPRQVLWWGPFTEFVSETILQAAQTDMTADEVIDTLADEWNDLKAEYE
jgi:multiple sugar transport system substrate-binding protein